MFDMDLRHLDMKPADSTPSLLPGPMLPPNQHPIPLVNQNHVPWALLTQSLNDCIDWRTWLLTNLAIDELGYWQTWSLVNLAIGELSH